jgi:CHAD domain-containing protein
MVLTDASRAVELEAKLIALPDLELPDLGGAGKGLTAVPQARRDLEAVYYDTTDLRLARSDVTLRYRSGESGKPWTVKLPSGDRGPALSRHEITFDGPPDGLPAGAVDLVTAVTRGRALKPVARLSTIRLPVQIHDATGRALAEVVDDTVRAWSGRRQLAEFREVEVEVFDQTATGRRLLDRIVERLVKAGCTQEEPVPKLVRALGDQAIQPPDVHVDPLPAEPTVTDVVRHAIVRSVAQIIRHDPGVRLGDDPEDVHQLRVGTRRLRSDLRTFAPLLEPDRVGPIRSELRWLGTEVGAVRDTDVLGMRMRELVSALPDADQAAGGMLLGRLDARAVTARESMCAALRDRRYLELLDSLVGLAASPPFGDDPDLADQPPAAVAAGLVRRPWKHLSRVVATLGPEPTDGELHRVRILAKRCRYAAEAVAPLTHPSAGPFAKAIAEVQTVLGDHQDTVVAEAWLREAAASAPAAGIAAGLLIAAERARRSELRARWPEVWRHASAKKLRKWL